MTNDDIQALFEKAREAQSLFWEALHALENALGENRGTLIELDGTADLSAFDNADDLLSSC